jgi:hypothetical protein
MQQIRTGVWADRPIFGHSTAHAESIYSPPASQELLLGSNRRHLEFLSTIEDSSLEQVPSQTRSVLPITPYKYLRSASGLK